MPSLRQVVDYIHAAQLALAAEEQKLHPANKHHYNWSPAEIKQISKKAAWHRQVLTYWLGEHTKITGKPSWTPLQEVVIEEKSPARKAEEALEKQQKKKAREQLYYAMGLADTSLFRLKGYKNSLSQRGSSFMGVTAIVLGGGSNTNMILVEVHAIRPAEKLLADANAAYRRKEYEKAASLTESALKKIRAGEAALSKHMGHVETGCGRAIAIVKIWSVAATAPLGGGVGTEMFGQAATEVTTLVAEGATGGHVSADDIATSIFNVATAGLSAKMGDYGKDVLGKQVFKYLAGKGLVGKGSKEAIQEAVGTLCSNNSKAAGELLLKLAKKEPLDQAGINFLVATISAGLGGAGKPLPEGEVRDMVVEELGAGK
jgi:hypothetical protein